MVFIKERPDTTDEPLMTTLLDILRSLWRRREPRVLVWINTTRGPRAVPLRDL